MRMRRVAVALALLSAAATALPAGAGARTIYVTNFGFLGEKVDLPGSISKVDAQANTATPPIEFGTHPAGIAITPDGRRGYLINDNPASVLPLDLTTDRPIGAPIPVGKGLEGVAISPDGSRVYMTDFSQDSVFVLDTHSNTVAAKSIEVGDGPENVIFAPDGAHAYVTNAEGDSVSVIDTSTGLVTATVPVGDRPGGIAITPDGRSVYVANDISGTVSVIDTATNGVTGLPIEVGTDPEWVTVSPDDTAVYVSNFGSSSVSVIDPQTNEVLTTVVVGEEEPQGIAVSPDSGTWFVTTLADQMVRGFRADSEHALDGPIGVGVEPSRLVFSPDQPPSASFATPALTRPGLPVSFDASASRDADGSIAIFAWNFGDGSATQSAGPAPAHIYSSPGTYSVSLTLTDDEGCSTTLVYTGQTASCNGSAAARATGSVAVAYPAVHLRCPGRAGRRGCLFKLRAVTKRKHGRAESALARVKSRAGHSALVSLRPTTGFADRFGIGSRILAKLTSRIGTDIRTKFARLTIVG